MSDAQEPHYLYDPSVPTLTDVVVTGDAARTGSAPSTAPSRAGQPAAGAPAAAPAATASAASGAAAPNVDALVERLRGRCHAWLAGEGQAVIEARCRAALQAHTDRLVGEITREVGLALETELVDWVRDAMRDETASRSGGGA